MAKWVRQSVTSSVSNTARNRTRYLTGLTGIVDHTIRAYFQERPNGEDITVEVAKAVGPERLAATDPGRSFDRKKQDLGLFVALRLVDLFGAARVLTYREDHGRNVSTRAARRPDVPWLNRFTPHRLVVPGTTDRIVLDTNAVRDFIHGHDGALDVDKLQELRGAHPISVADPAWAEFAHALLRPDGGMEVAEWAAKVAKLSAILDPEMPVVPSGREAAMMAGIVQMPGFDLSEAQAFYRAVWLFVARVNTEADFSRPMVFENPDGRQFEVGALEHATVAAALAERKAKWVDFIDRVKKLFGGLSTSPTLDDIVALVRSNLRLDLPDAALDKLGLLIGAVSRYIARALDSKQPYTPSGNDAIDLDVLFAAVLPAIICTSDRRMRTAARESGSGDAWRVMSIEELMKWLERERAEADVATRKQMSITAETAKAGASPEECAG